LRFGVALDGDDVQFGVRADADHRHRFSGLVAVGPGGPDVGVENPGVERFQAFGILGYPGNVVDSVEQHSSSPSQLTVLSVCTLHAMIEPPYWWRVTGHPSARPTR
jgi:hypothetical protein